MPARYARLGDRSSSGSGLRLCSVPRRERPVQRRAIRRNGSRVGPAGSEQHALQERMFTPISTTTSAATRRANAMTLRRLMEVPMDNRQRFALGAAVGALAALAAGRVVARPPCHRLCWPRRRHHRRLARSRAGARAAARGRGGAPVPDRPRRSRAGAGSRSAFDRGPTS